MAEGRCRKCGNTVPAGAATCPHCGVEAPLEPGPAAGAAAGAGTRAETGPPPERGSAAGSRLSKAVKAVGCLVLALIVLGIAIVLGLFDLFF